SPLRPEHSASKKLSTPLPTLVTAPAPAMRQCIVPLPALMIRSRSFLIPAVDHHGIVAAEGESVVLNDAEIRVHRMVRHTVEPAFRVGFDVVDGGRNKPLGNGERTGDGGQCAGSTHAVADHRLDGYGAWRRVITENLSNR